MPDCAHCNRPLKFDKVGQEICLGCQAVFQVAAFDLISVPTDQAKDTADLEQRPTAQRRLRA